MKHTTNVYDKVYDRSPAQHINRSIWQGFLTTHPLHTPYTPPTHPLLKMPVFLKQRGSERVFRSPPARCGG